MDLDRLEASKRAFGLKEQIALPALLLRLGRARFDNAESLIRVHEALLFFGRIRQIKTCCGSPMSCFS